MPCNGMFTRLILEGLCRRVLGLTINDAETRHRLVSSFQRAVAENQGTIAACFNPRHGIRVTRKQKQVEFVICFECTEFGYLAWFEANSLSRIRPRHSSIAFFATRVFRATTWRRMIISSESGITPLAWLS
jgi:hypothetical protein